MIDATGTIILGHQNHDYSHLPGNKPPYKMIESLNNVRMGGGRRTIYTLKDATHSIVNGKIEKQPLTWARFVRSLETIPLTHLRSFALAELVFWMFHPKRAYWEWRQIRAGKL